MLLWIFRGAFVVLMVGLSLVALQLNFRESAWVGVASAFLILLLTAGVILADMSIRDKQITTISAVYFGMLLGLLLGAILTVALDPFFEYWLPTPPPGTTGYATNYILGKNLLRLILTAICCYVSVSVLLQTKDEFRFIIPYVEFSKQLKGVKPLVLDTSVIIDGRIADICDTRLVDSKMVVPRFVLQELQAIADSSDKLKRNRGRRGLDILKRMQTNPKIELQIHDANMSEVKEVNRVDERLVQFTKAVGGRVVTNDFNLNKIAQLQGVDVINLNEVANALKTVALPGEAMNVKLVKPGDQMGQGVGYLEDGTMVVVEGGKQYVGSEVLLTVTSVLQTPAGRMIFGRMGGGSSAEMPKLQT